jgi:A/G-specific adenine glycosylase
LLRWYDEHARGLPWRRDSATPWAVLVSEVMLQQTPVNRVLPVYERWMARWPTPSSLAVERPGEAVRMWNRLGYPRRALRLHQAARAVREHHDGLVPSSYEELLRLPGIGDYTASAVAAFAFGRRGVVLDTNVRRVLGRVAAGVAAPGSAVTSAERGRAEMLLPDDPARAVRWSVAAMELGALVCAARSPACDRCPLAGSCAWRAAGYPLGNRAPRAQAYAGTDRQCRGRLLAVLRAATEPVALTTLAPAWDDAVQRERALASLLDDGLVVQVGEGSIGLP